MKAVSISVINDLSTDQRVLRLAYTLSHRGYKVRLIGRKLRLSPPSETIPFLSHRFRLVINYGPFFYAFYNIRLFFYLLFIRRPSLLISVDLDTLPANFLVAKIRNIPLFYDSHEYFTEVPELIGRRFIKQTWERIERTFVPGLKYAMTVSRSISRDYKEKYGVDFRVIRNLPQMKQPVVYSGFNDAYPSTYKIIYQGALNLGRGIELMISSMRYIENTVLIIVGDGDIRKELQYLTTSMKLNHKVHFLGRVIPEKLHKITCQCDVGLSLEEDMGLSYRYSLPNKVFDYIQARIPVFCSNLPEMAALVSEYEIGVVCRERMPEAIAGQIRELLNDTDGNSTLKKNLENAAKTLSWENEEKEFIEILDGLDGTGNSRQGNMTD